jgi:ribosomal protein S12 methylthiotransferase
MRRGGTSKSVRGILERLREEVPGITLRTTVLVGHPGEGAAEFEELIDFLAEFRIDRLGAFAFSPEVGTPSGDDPDRCAHEEALERLHRVMEVQSRVHFERQEARIGGEDLVLIDGRQGELAVGRTGADAPEVDGLVQVADPQERLQTGDLVTVRVTAASEYDLVAELVED